MKSRKKSKKPQSPLIEKSRKLVNAILGELLKVSKRPVKVKGSEPLTERKKAIINSKQSNRDKIVRRL